MQAPLPTSGFAVQEDEGAISIRDVSGAVIGRVKGASLEYDSPSGPALRYRDTIRGWHVWAVESGTTLARPVAARGAEGVDPYRCHVTDLSGGHRVEVCGGATTEPTIRLDGHKVAGSAFPAISGSWPGHWRWAQRSPDGSALIGQWSGECEVPIGYRVALPSATLHSLDSTASPSVESFALSWTTGGAVLAHFPAGGCGDGLGVPGIYQVVSTGKPKLLLASKKQHFAGWRAGATPVEQLYPKAADPITEWDTAADRLQAYLRAWQNDPVAADKDYLALEGTETASRAPSRAVLRHAEGARWTSADEFQLMVDLDVDFGQQYGNWTNGTNTRWVTFTRSSSEKPYRMTFATSP